MRPALCALLLLAACDKQSPRVAERTPQPARDAGVSDAARPDAAPADAAVKRARPEGNTGTCQMMVPVARAQARKEAVKGAKRGAAGCPTAILHGVVFARGDQPVMGEVELSDFMTLERLKAHEPDFCVYTLSMGCP